MSTPSYPSNCSAAPDELDPFPITYSPSATISPVDSCHTVQWYRIGAGLGFPQEIQDPPSAPPAQCASGGTPLALVGASLGGSALHAPATRVTTRRPRRRSWPNRGAPSWAPPRSAHRASSHAPRPANPAASSIPTSPAATSGSASKPCRCLWSSGTPTAGRSTPGAPAYATSSSLLEPG